MNLIDAPRLIAHSNALADWNHPEIVEKAKSFSIGCYTPREYFHALHEYVRESVPFGFNTQGHHVKASEVLEEGLGFGITKTTLLLALCRAAGIPVRLHTGRMKTAILKGLVNWLPPTMPHAFLEVQLEGFWRPVDSYIVDRRLAAAAERHLVRNQWSVGYGVALDGAPFSVETCLDGQGFVQMGAMVEDHGVYDDPVLYFNSDACKPHDRIHEGVIGRLYRQRLPELNAKIQALRG